MYEHTGDLVRGGTAKARDKRRDGNHGLPRRSRIAKTKGGGPRSEFHNDLAPAPLKDSSPSHDHKYRRAGSRTGRRRCKKFSTRLGRNGTSSCAKQRHKKGKLLADPPRPSISAKFGGPGYRIRKRGTRSLFATKRRPNGPSFAGPLPGAGSGNQKQTGFEKKFVALAPPCVGRSTSQKTGLPP